MQTLQNIFSASSRVGLAPLGLLVWLAAGLSPAWAQPVNDNFANAQLLFGPGGFISGNSTGATEEPGEAFIVGIPAGASVWYKWTAPASGPVTFATAGSEFDTI